MSRTVHTGLGRTLTLTARPLGTPGRAGAVLGVVDRPDAAVKLYFKPELHRERLQAMLRSYDFRELRNGHMQLAWPADVVMLDGEGVSGFVMERLDTAGFRSLNKLSQPTSRAEHFPGFTWRSLYRVGANLARSVARLHGVGIVVGDMSEGNVWVSQREVVGFIDCDSMQFADKESGRVFPSLYATPDWAAPELLDAGGAEARRRRESDDFTLGLLLCTLLMDGNHPFRGLPAENLREGNCWLLQPERFTPPEEWPRHPRELPLPPRVLRLAEACFRDGHRAPERRPTAATWAEALELAAEELVTCARNPAHDYFRGVSECPWCRRDGVAATTAAPAEPPHKRFTVEPEPEPVPVAAEPPRPRFVVVDPSAPPPARTPAAPPQVQRPAATASPPRITITPPTTTPPATTTPAAPPRRQETAPPPRQVPPPKPYTPPPDTPPTLWDEIFAALEDPQVRLVAIVIALVLLVAFCGVVL